MEQQLNFVPVLSLEKLSLRKVVINLWNETDILLFFDKFRFRYQYGRKYNVQYYKEKRKEIEDAVKDKVSKLLLAGSLKIKMIPIVRPIGYELVKWQLYHAQILPNAHEIFHMGLLKSLYWTSTGLINYQKSAEILVGFNEIDIEARHRLACFYCLEKLIPVIWEELPEEKKNCFYESFNITIWRDVSMEAYWAHVIKGEETKLNSIISRGLCEGISFNEYAFEGSARIGNKTATEYFFLRLTEKEKTIALFRTMYLVMVCGRRSARPSGYFPLERISDILCYLLSVMTPNNRVRVYMEHPGEVLGCLLEWPWQHLFLDVAGVILNLLHETRYDDVLNKIIENVKQSDYFSPNLIVDFFKNSPDSFKQNFINYECSNCNFLAKFLNVEDIQTIRVVLKQVYVKDITRLVFNDSFYNLLDDLMREEKWKLIILIFREASLSEKDKERLKQAVTDYLMPPTPSPNYTYEAVIFNDVILPGPWHGLPMRPHGNNIKNVKNPRLKHLFAILDKINANVPDKRNPECEAQSEIKKLCSEKQKRNFP